MKSSIKPEHMKNVILILLVAAIGFVGCKKCKGEDPRARVVNNGSQSVSVHIQTSGGNTVNINNIDAGMSSEYQSFAPGAVDYTITVGNGNNSNDYQTSVTMEECFEYDIQIDENNQITSVPTDRNE